MPAKSKQQQKFMGMVHALNKGDIKPSDVSQSVRDVAKNIKKSDAEDFASTKHSGLPKRVKQEILDALKEYANKMSGNKHGGSGSYGYAPQKGLRDDDGYEDNEEVKDESKGVPQNYMQGRTSDYHTALRGKNRDYSGGTNFKKTNHGQPDLENDDEDQETNQLSVQQTKLKEEMGKLSSSERIELYKLYSKAMKAMPGSPNQKKIKILINKLRKKADLKPLPINEAKLDHHRISGNSIELLVRHNRQKYAIKFKDKRILDKMGFDWSKPKNIEKLLSLKKFPKGMSVSRSFHEYGQRLDLSFIEDEESRLDGTPKPKDAIDRDIDENVKQMTAQILRMKKGEMKPYELPSKTQKFYYKNKKKFDSLKEYSGGSYEYTKGDQYGQNSVDEGTMIRLAGQIAQELLPKDTWSRFANDGKKNKEFVKSVVKDLAQTLNRFYKSHNISVRIKENKIELDEIGVFPIQNYIKGIIPSDFIDSTTRDKKEKLQSTLRDLKSTLNRFWKQHNIPYRIK